MSPLKWPHISPPRRFPSPFRCWFRSGVVWQRALAAKRARGGLGCIKHGANRGGCPAAVSSGVASPGILCSSGLCSYIQRRESKLVKAVAYENQLRTSGLPGLEKRRLRVILITLRLLEEGKWRHEMLISSPWCPVNIPGFVAMIQSCTRSSLG